MPESPQLTQTKTKRSWPRKAINIILIVIAASCLICVTVGWITDTLSPTPAITPQAIESPAVNIPPATTTEKTSRCVTPSPLQLEAIRLGIQSVDPNNDISNNARAVRSNDYQLVWFVAVEITGNGIKPKEAVGVWAINGELESPGLTLSVDGFAQNFSAYPDAGKTDAQITMFDDGAQEAKDCVINK